MKNATLHPRFLSLLPAVFALIFLVSLSAYSQIPAKEKPQTHVKITLNAFSFNDLLLPNPTTGKQAFTIPELLDWCAIQNIEAVDLTGYYFPGYPEVPSDEYIYEIKRKVLPPGL